MMMSSPEISRGLPKPGFNLPLHEDIRLVTETNLEEQLALVAANAIAPIVGIFGPASVTWRIDREAIVFLAAGRALLLQLAHPWIAAAIAEHSRVPAEPIVRFHRTFSVVFALVFGTTDQALAAARLLHRRHSQVTGYLPEPAGPFKAGSRYFANNVAALRWVYATLIESALVAHDLIFEPLSVEDRARHYRESQLFAGMLGIPRDALPGDYKGLAAYTRAMCNSDVLTVTTSARRLANQIFNGSDSWLRIPAGYRAVTAGILPDRLRVDFGLPYGETERRVSDRSVGLIRRNYSRVPRRFRYVGPYQEALQRLAGAAQPDFATRLLNRFWIGRPSLVN